LRKTAPNTHRLPFANFAHAHAYIYTRVLLGAFFAVCVFAGNAFAQSSASYRLDYGRTVSDAGTKQSTSFHLIDAVSEISAEGTSSSFNLRNVYAGLPAAGGPVCGNSLIEGVEQCDTANFNGLTCSDFGYNSGNLLCPTCLIDTSGCYNTGGGGAICGNSIKEAGEQCDDGNKSNGDGCSSGCRLENWKCGNGIIEGAEECDDGNVNTGDGCTPQCKLEFAVPVPVCGNSIKETGEQCDDGNVTDKDGCSSACKLEVAEGEEELTFNVETGEKPFFIIKPVPVTIIPTKLRPAAPEQVNEQFHFEDYLVEEKITILDETPLIATQLDANKVYELIVLDKNGTEVGRQGGQTDNGGILKIEVLPYLDYDSYTLQIFDKEHKLIKRFPVTIEDSQYRLHESLTLDGEVQRDTICLGKVEKKDNLFLEGRGKPSTKYFAYFQPLATPRKGSVNPVTVVKVTADTGGNYKLPVPEHLKTGSYHMDIVQVYEDGKVSRNVRYVFELTDKSNLPCIWVIIAIALMALLSRYEQAKNLIKKSLGRKNGFKIRMIMTILLLITIANLSTVSAAVTTPNVFIYEGKLLNPSNNPITTPHTFRFSLWSSTDLVAGDVVGGTINGAAPTYGGWQEAQTVTPNVDGTFFFKLGWVNPMVNMNLALHKFLMVEIKPQGSPDTSYELMDPTGDNGADADDRQTIGSTPYTNNADFLDYAELGTGAGNIATLDVGGVWNINFIPGGTNADTFVIDNDNTSVGNIALQFGNLLGAILKFDIVNNWFEFNNDINLAQNEIKNFAIDNLAAPPGAPVAGQMYHNTLDGNTYIWNGAVWEDITAAAAGADLDTTYTADADKKMNVNNAAGLEFESTVAGNMAFDLQSTGDLVVQSGGTTFATFTDGGNVGIGTTAPSTKLEVNSGAANTTPIFTLGNTAGDVQMFRADATPEGSVTGSIGDITIDGTNGNAYIKNSGNATNTGWVQFGGAKVKELVFNAGYEDSVAIGDGTNNRGTLTSKMVDIGARKYNFYEWNTLNAGMQDVDVQFSIKLPDDFISFTATPLQVIYNTNDGNIANNKVDVSLYDTTDTAVALAGGNNLANAAWTTANITFGGAPTFTPGGTITLVIKFSTINTGFAKTADVIFQYNGN